MVRKIIADECRYKNKKVHVLLVWSIDFSVTSLVLLIFLNVEASLLSLYRHIGFWNS